MMKKFLSLFSINAIMLPVISLTISCKKGESVNTDLPLKEIFESKAKTVDIGIEGSILLLTEVQFDINKKTNDYFKNLQFIALSVLNKIEKSCFLDTSFIKVTMYRDESRNQEIKDNDDLKKDDVALSKSIYIGFAMHLQNGKPENNNFNNLLCLNFVNYGSGLFNMEKTVQQPYCESKNHEL